jgi:hypothetical protein
MRRRKIMSRIRRATVVTLASILFLSAACNSDPVGIDGRLPDAELRVLFIGNSLTYTNDLPAMVQTIAEAAGHTLAQATVAEPNVSLEDLWFGGVEEAVSGSQQGQSQDPMIP